MSAESALAAHVERILDRSTTRGRRGCFVVVCPVYNRGRTLPRALDSLVAQTYENWLCVILDDGSTDGTERVGEAYARRDRRFLYARFDENRGGVAMNEIGMRLACELGEFWSRLGSDDWFERHKLMVDYVTLGRNELPACFGPYRCVREHLLDRVLARRGIGPLRIPSRVAESSAHAALRSEVLRKLRRSFGAFAEPLKSAPMDARRTLLSGRFAMSWANAAIRSDVLRVVRARFGSFCDPRSRNMEDFHCNARVASVSSIVWRGLKKDRKTVVISARTWAEAGHESEFVHDGTWRLARDGASSNGPQVERDTRITLAAIDADLAQHPPEARPEIPLRVVRL